MKNEFEREYKGTKVRVQYPLDLEDIFVTNLPLNVATRRINVGNVKVLKISDINEALFKQEHVIRSLAHLDYGERRKALDFLIFLSQKGKINELSFLAPTNLKARRLSNEIFASIIIREKRQAWLTLRKRLLEKMLPKTISFTVHGQRWQKNYCN